MKLLQLPMWQLVSVRVALAVFTWGMLAWGKRDWDRRLKRWAADEKLTLISFKAAHAFEGPPGVRGSENVTILKVRVRGRESGAAIRNAWVVFGTAMNPFSSSVEVHWID